MADVKKHVVNDRIKVLMANSGNEIAEVEYKALIEELETLYKQNMHKAYNEYKVSLVKDKDAGWGLLFVGVRDERSEETATRESVEDAKKKQLDSAELREYLRLHKKYGKKEN